MTTKTDVINEALIACGEPEMVGANDTSTWVKRVSNRYLATVKRTLEGHPWNFAATRVQLQVLGATPIGRDFAYNKPADVLRINLINTTGDARDEASFDYEDEGGQILTNLDPCYLFYVSAAWLTKEGAWPQVFADAVSAALAYKCYALFGKAETKKEQLGKDAEITLGSARSWDSSQKPWRPLPRGEWAKSRTRGRRSLTGDWTG